MENFKRGMDRLTDVRQEMNAMHERSEKLKVRHFRIYSFRGRYLGTHLICWRRFAIWGPQISFHQLLK